MIDTAQLKAHFIFEYLPPNVLSTPSRIHEPIPGN